MALKIIELTLLLHISKQMKRRDERGEEKQQNKELNKLAQNSFIEMNFALIGLAQHQININNIASESALHSSIHKTTQ